MLISFYDCLCKTVPQTKQVIMSKFPLHSEGITLFRKTRGHHRKIASTFLSVIQLNYITYRTNVQSKSPTEETFTFLHQGDKMFVSGRGFPVLAYLRASIKATMEDITLVIATSICIISFATRSSSFV